METSVRLKPGHTYAIGLVLPFPASLAMTGPALFEQVDEWDAGEALGFTAKNCPNCGAWPVAQSPYQRSDRRGATHVVILRYEGAERDVAESDLALKWLAGVSWIEDVNESSMGKWLLGGAVVGGLGLLLWWAGAFED